MRAGDLSHRFTFASRDLVDDGRGNEVAGAWKDEFTTAAGLLYLRGSETVLASRLSGRQPVVITVRQNQHTRRITGEWRAKNAKTGELYNIRTIVPTDDRAGFEITAESGVTI